MMHQIEPYFLCTGHAGDGRDFQALLARGIQALVQLAVEEPVVQLPREVVYLRFSPVDSPARVERI